MLHEKAKAYLEDALSWLDEVSELTEALRMAQEQIEQNPENLLLRLNFIIRNCESSLTMIDNEAKFNISVALYKLEQAGLPGPLAQPEPKPKFRISETVSEMPKRGSA